LTWSFKRARALSSPARLLHHAISFKITATESPIAASAQGRSIIPTANPVSSKLLGDKQSDTGDLEGSFLYRFTEHFEIFAAAVFESALTTHRSETPHYYYIRFCHA
jgi:hypothetical protein